MREWLLEALQVPCGIFNSTYIISCISYLSTSYRFAVNCLSVMATIPDFLGT